MPVASAKARAKRPPRRRGRHTVGPASGAQDNTSGGPCQGFGTKNLQKNRFSGKLVEFRFFSANFSLKPQQKWRISEKRMLRRSRNGSEGGGKVGGGGHASWRQLPTALTIFPGAGSPTPRAPAKTPALLLRAPVTFPSVFPHLSGLPGLPLRRTSITFPGVFSSFFGASGFTPSGPEKGPQRQSLSAPASG